MNPDWAVQAWALTQKFKVYNMMIIGTFVMASPTFILARVHHGGRLPLVHVDPVLVQQALVQIFDNAAKYSQPGSQISVAARARSPANR